MEPGFFLYPLLKGLVGIVQRYAFRMNSFDPLYVKVAAGVLTIALLVWMTLWAIADFSWLW